MNEEVMLVLGVLSNCMWGDSFARRNMARQTYMQIEQSNVDFRFVVGTMKSDLTPLPRALFERMSRENVTNLDMLFLDVPERKSPVLKTLGWYRYAISHIRTKFVGKMDDDAYAHPVKLYYNLKPLVGNNLVYLGSTLWGSYSPQTFQACARRMGPLMAAAAMQEEGCLEKGAIGPFPYVVGMMQILSTFLARWIVDQPFTQDFEEREHIKQLRPQ